MRLDPGRIGHQHRSHLASVGPHGRVIDARAPPADQHVVGLDAGLVWRALQRQGIAQGAGDIERPQERGGDVWRQRFAEPRLRFIEEVARLLVADVPASRNEVRAGAPQQGSGVARAQVVQFESGHESERAGKAIQHVGMSRGQHLVGLDGRTLVAEPALGTGHTGQHAGVRDRRDVFTCEASAVGRQGPWRAASELLRLGLLHRRPALTGHRDRLIPASSGDTRRDARPRGPRRGGGRAPRDASAAMHPFPVETASRPRRTRRHREAGGRRVRDANRQRARRLVGGQPEIGRLELRDRLLLPAHGLQPEGQQHERRHRDREGIQQHPG